MFECCGYNITMIFHRDPVLPVKWMAIESLKETPLCTHKNDMLVCVCVYVCMGVRVCVCMCMCICMHG